MSQQHTPEPWALREGWEGSIFYKEQTIGRCCEPQTEDNARRIVACVNACAGIATDALETIADQQDWYSGLDKLTKERDELRAKLAEAEIDAKRYRWLKSTGKVVSIDFFKDHYRAVDVSVNLIITDWLPSFDEAVDAGMEAMKEQP